MAHADASSQTRLNRALGHVKVVSVNPRMSSGYRALLQSLDETEKDVTRGLGHQVKIKKRSRPCCCCCKGNACLWTCIATVILLGLVLSIGVPILLTVPTESSWHWKHWLNFWKQPANNISNPGNNSLPDVTNAVGYLEKPLNVFVHQFLNGIYFRRTTKMEQTGRLHPLKILKEISDCRKRAVRRRTLSSTRPSLNCAR